MSIPKLTIQGHFSIVDPDSLTLLKMCPNPLGQSKHFPQSFSDITCDEGALEHPNVQEAFKTKVTRMNSTFSILESKISKLKTGSACLVRVELKTSCEFFMHVFDGSNTDSGDFGDVFH